MLNTWKCIISLKFWFTGCNLLKPCLVKQSLVKYTGVSVLFRWCGDIPLKVRFGRLFDLSLNKSITVKDMFVHGWGEDGDAWQWRRGLRVWEEELLAECRVLLANVSLQPLSFDVWQWLPDPLEGYSVRAVYSMLTDQGAPQVPQDVDLIWHRQVPLKVSITAWRSLRDRLPTKSNLALRGVLHAEACLCVAGCGSREDVSHLFLLCPCFGSLWPMVRHWIGFAGIDHCDISSHFVQFIYSTGGLKARRSFLQLVWLLTVWVLWSERNNRLFNMKESSMPQLLDKVKYYSLWWLKANKAIFVFGDQLWWSSPLSCLGIGWPLSCTFLTEMLVFSSCLIGTSCAVRLTSAC